jgi:hypothetical protein
LTGPRAPVERDEAVARVPAARDPARDPLERAEPAERDEPPERAEAPEPEEPAERDDAERDEAEREPVERDEAEPERAEAERAEPESDELARLGCEELFPPAWPEGSRFDGSLLLGCGMRLLLRALDAA